ncbi:MAG: hypothetical protein ABS79_04600 [Planctomycetes bacterium SCN 63-9]|nr:MAG: hypothetical protein ABS79_04600 [Planctomycetes bacterium SCN 63-9]
MKNRRRTPRLHATEFRVWLGLWVSPDRFEAQAARIENISLGGARIVSLSPLNRSQSVWLRMGTPACMECVGATVLEVEKLPEGDYAVRLEFDAPCPRHLILTATEGCIPHPHFRRQPDRASTREIVASHELTHRS